MPVKIHSVPPSDVMPAEMQAWQNVPVAVAVDLAREIGQIDPAIRPLNPPGRQKRLFGRAVTAFCEPPDFGAVMHALECVGPGDVLMIAAAGNREFAMIGDILGGHLRARGCVGLVCDGAIRDVGMLAGWDDFSVYSRFITPRGPMSAERGAVNRAVVIGGQMVQPGDLIIGDDDGLVALSPAHMRTYIGGAKDKMAREEEWLASLASGRSPTETFALPPAKRL